MPGEGKDELRGYVDHIGFDCIAGWAQSVCYPEAPVCVDVYVDGVLQTTAGFMAPGSFASGVSLIFDFHKARYKPLPMR